MNSTLAATASARRSSSLLIVGLALLVAISALLLSWLPGQPGRTNSGIQLPLVGYVQDPYNVLAFSTCPPSSAGSLTCSTSANGSLVLLDDRSNNQVGTWTVGKAPVYSDFDFAQNLIFAANSGDGTVSVGDGSALPTLASNAPPSGTPITTVGTVGVGLTRGSAPYGLCVNGKGKAGVTGSADNTFTQIAGASGGVQNGSHNVTTHVLTSIGTAPHGVVCDKAQNLDITANNGSGNISGIDVGNTNPALLGQVAITDPTNPTAKWKPEALTIDPSSGLLYVVSASAANPSGANGLLVALKYTKSPFTATTVGATAIPPDPRFVTVNSSGVIAVTSNAANQVNLCTFGSSQFTATGTALVGKGPFGAGYAAGVLYVADNKVSALSIVTQATGGATSAGCMAPAGGASTATIGDTTPPTTGFTSPPGFVLPSAAIQGPATDDISGVGSVLYGFNPPGATIAPSTSFQGTISCTDTSRLSCTWSGSAPSGAGLYDVWTSGTDRNGVGVAGTTDTPNVEVFHKVGSLQVAGPPSAPQNLTASGGTGQISLAWTPPVSTNGAPLTQYSVYRSSGGAFSQIATTTPATTSYVDSGLSPGATFSYKVTATNSQGEGAASKVATATTNSAPSAPQNLKLSSPPTAVGEIDLSWSAPLNNGGLGVTSYNIYRSDNGGAYAKVGTVSGSTLTFSQTGLQVLTSYTYRVTAVNPLGEGPASNTACAKPAPLGGLLSC